MDEDIERKAEAEAHNLAMGWASHIAAIDSSSIAVARYLEEELRSLFGLRSLAEFRRDALIELNPALARAAGLKLSRARATEEAEAKSLPWDEGGRDQYFTKLPGDARLVAGLPPIDADDAKECAELMQEILLGIKQGFDPSNCTNNYAINSALKAWHKLAAKLEQRR